MLKENALKDFLNGSLHFAVPDDDQVGDKTQNLVTSLSALVLPERCGRRTHRRPNICDCPGVEAAASCRLRCCGAEANGAYASDVGLAAAGSDSLGLSSWTMP